MKRTLVVIALLASGASLAGCSGTSLVTGSRSATRATPPDTSAYLTSLSAEQAKLAAAEKRIPTHPRTPTALSRSIALLAAAVRQLADGLSTIRPPAAVAAMHTQLVAIARSYAAQLIQVASTAARPDRELRAAGLLVSATNAASAAFARTVARIDTSLSR